jgi:hypothetical protein
MERTRAYGKSVAVGSLLVLIGTLHQCIGVLLWWRVILAVLRDGFVDAIAGDPLRMAVFWFLIAGWLMIIAGQALREIERVRPLPARFGWRLIAFAVVGGLAIPASGFWLAIPLGLLTLARARVRV